MAEFPKPEQVLRRGALVVQVWHDVAAIDPEFGPSVVTIGNFDGVHLGHRHVLQRAREIATERGGLPVVAVTFDPHPMTVIRPDKAPTWLISLDERVRLLGEAGADGVLVLRFTEELANVEPEEFAAAVLIEGLRARAVVVGQNFRFGRRARGDVALLTEVCDQHEVSVEGIPLDGAHGETWSSTYVRDRLTHGDVAAAAEALGRPFAVMGTVVPGDRRGRDLGYPTANVPVMSSRRTVPADGVYAGWLRRRDEQPGEWWPAAISVGTNPTFDGDQRRVEAYVLDRDDLELYGALVEIAFYERLRGMVRFEAIDDLLAQMRADVDRARDLLATASVGPRG
jgi:riboflavin kinase/FMN adenylyltransferase